MGSRIQLEVANERFGSNVSVLLGDSPGGFDQVAVVLVHGVFAGLGSMLAVRALGTLIGIWASGSLLAVWAFGSELSVVVAVRRFLDAEGAAVSMGRFLKVVRTTDD